MEYNAHLGEVLRAGRAADAGGHPEPLRQEGIEAESRNHPGMDVDMIAKVLASAMGGETSQVDQTAHAWAARWRTAHAEDDASSRTR